MDMHKKFTDRIGPVATKSHVDLPFEPNTRSCQEWVDDLPILDAASTAGMMLTVTQGLLSTTVAPYTEFKISEVVSPYVIKLTTLYLKATEGTKLPLSQKQAELSTQTLKVLTNAQAVYQNIICSAYFAKNSADESGDDTPIFSKHQKGLIIHRAVELLGIIQFFESLVYKPTDAGFWNALNALFTLAEDLQVHQLDYLKVNGNSHTTIENEFKKIHFFNLARPNRFRQGDIKTIQRILSLQANNITMSSNQEVSTSFYIDLSSSKPISHVATLKEHDQCRFIDNKLLVQFIQSDQLVAPERQVTISMTPEKPILSKKVIQQLLPSWSTQQSRQSPRYEQTEELTVYPGFDSVIRALVLKQNPDYFGKKPAQTTKPRHDFGIDNLHLIPIEERYKSQHTINDTDVNKALKASAENSLSANSIWTKNLIKPGEKGHSMEATMNDISLQGLRFQIAANNQALLNANDLIGIQTKTGPLQLAIIRRINKLEDGDISVGVEMMSPNLKIANIKFHNKELPPKPAIFLQGIPSIHQPDSIITPLLLNNTAKSIILKTKDTLNTYRLDKLIETNQVFNHYTVLKESDLDYGKQ